MISSVTASFPSVSVETQHTGSNDEQEQHSSDTSVSISSSLSKELTSLIESSEAVSFPCTKTSSSYLSREIRDDVSEVSIAAPNGQIYRELMGVRIKTGHSDESVSSNSADARPSYWDSSSDVSTA